jgi:hypothetical protein
MKKRGLFVSVVEQRLIQIIADVYGRTRQPVRTIAICSYIPKGDRDIRRWLVRMTERGLIVRVGQRGGWLPVHVDRCSQLVEIADRAPSRPAHYLN